MRMIWMMKIVQWLTVLRKAVAVTAIAITNKSNLTDIFPDFFAENKREHNTLIQKNQQDLYDWIKMIVRLSFVILMM